MSKYTFCVITKVPKPWLGEDGNLYSATFAMDEYPSSDLYIIDNTDYDGKEERKSRAVTYEEMNKLLPSHDFDFMLENFTLGEICILDEPLGREIAGKRRAPRKWFIEFEEFDDLDKAVERARDVLRHDELLDMKDWYLGEGAEYATDEEKEWLRNQQ